MDGILVVDGEAAICSLLDMFLRSERFVVWTATTSEEAIALFQAHHESIQVVLLDADLLDLLPALEKIKPTIRHCVMNADMQPGKNGLVKDTARMIPKPFSLEKLRSVLQDLSSDEFFRAG